MESEVFWLHMSPIPFQVDQWAMVIMLVFLSELLKRIKSFLEIMTFRSIDSFIFYLDTEAIGLIHSFLF